MTIDEAISFCDEKSKNIKLKAEPQTFIDIKEMLEELKAMRNLDKTNFSDGYNKALDDCGKIITNAYDNGYIDGFSLAIIGENFQQLRK